MLPLIVFLALMAVTLMVALRHIEAWPITPYPMFSFYGKPDSVLIYRLRLTAKDGRRIMWKPKYPNYEELLRFNLTAFFDQGGLDKPKLRREMAKRLMFYINMHDNVFDYESIEVIARDLEAGDDGAFTVRERSCWTASVAELIQFTVLDDLA